MRQTCRDHSEQKLLKSFKKMILKASSLLFILWLLSISSEINCLDPFHRNSQWGKLQNQNFNRKHFFDNVPVCRQREHEDRLKRNSFNLPMCANNSVQALLAGLYVEGSTDRGDDLLPPWVNLPLAIRGQQFAMDHFPHVGMAHLYGLTLLLSLPQISDVLLFTGSSDTPEKAAQRYAATMLQVILWMRRALSKDKNNNWTFESLSNVRYLHLHAAKRAALALKNRKTLGLQKRFGAIPVNNPRWDAFNADLVNSNIPLEQRILPPILVQESGDNLTQPVGQFSLAMTQWAFLSIVIGYPREVLLFDGSNYDLQAFSHFWAVLGYALGIEDKFNVALHPDLKSTIKFSQEILESYVIPGLFNLSHGSKILLDAYIEGIADISLGLDPEFLLRRILKDILKIPTPEMDKRRTPLGSHEDNLFYSLSLNPALVAQISRYKSPLLSQSHFIIGLRYFGFRYISDAAISKQCYYFHQRL